MRLAIRLGSVIAASVFALQAHSAIIPVGLDITGNIGSTLIQGQVGEGNGTLDVTMETLGLVVNSSTDIDGSLGALVTVGDDPIDVVARFEETGSGFGFDGVFDSTMGSTDVEFGQYAGDFAFFIDNTTGDDFELTWTLNFDLTSDALLSFESLVETYIEFDFFGTVFSIDVFSDSFIDIGDFVSVDGVDSIPADEDIGTFGESVQRSGTQTFSMIINGGDSVDFGGFFGIFTDFMQDGDSSSAALSFDMTLTGVENVSTQQPPTTVPEPAPFALMLLSLGLLQLRRRK